MHQLLKKLILDQNGMIVSSEIVLVGTILVLGSIVGLASLSHAVTHELNDVAQACDHAFDSGNDGNDQDNYTITNSQGIPEMVGSGY